jgi:hypothetical protein
MPLWNVYVAIKNKVQNLWGQRMNKPLVKRSLAELDTVLEEIVQRNPEWYKEIQQLIEELKNER